MFFSNEKIGIGFSIYKENLAFVKLEKRKDNQIEIKNLDFVPFYPNINYKNLFSQENRKLIFETINQAAKQVKFDEYNCFLTLDSFLSYIVKIPIDRRLSDAEFKEHLKWEFSVLFEGENYEDYYCNSLKLYYNRPARPIASLVYFLKKEIIVFFKNIFEDLDIHINVVDIDHFALETICRNNYSRFSTTNSILLSVKNDSIEISLLYNGEFFNYRLFTVSENKKIYDILENEFKSIDNQVKELKLEKIYIYAPSLKTNELTNLFSLLPQKIEMINPFKKMVLSKNILSSQAIKNPNIYAPAIGVALRNFQL